MYTPYPKLVSQLRCLLCGEDPSDVDHIISDDHGKDMYKLFMTQSINSFFVVEVFYAPITSQPGK